MNRLSFGVKALLPVLALIFAVAVGSCATRQETGAVVGGAAGAAVGGAVSEGSPIGLLIGGALGAVLGSEVGRSMDEYDRRQAAYVLETTPTYQTQQWVNPDTGYQYQMTPVETYREPTGQPCREFRMDAEVGRYVEPVYGTACRQADGSWRIQPT